MSSICQVSVWRNYNVWIESQLETGFLEVSRLSKTAFTCEIGAHTCKPHHMGKHNATTSLRKMIWHRETHNNNAITAKFTASTASQNLEKNLGAAPPHHP